MSRTGSQIEIDISGLEPGSEATVVFDLIGNGAATSSRITIDNVAVSPSFLPSQGFEVRSLADSLPPVANVVGCQLDDDGLLDVVATLRNSDFVTVINDHVELGRASTASSHPAIETGRAIVAAAHAGDDIHITLGELTAASLSSGESLIYSFEAEAGQTIFFDVVTGTFDLEWAATMPSGTRLFDSFFLDAGPFELAETGTYEIRVKGRGDRFGDFSFLLWDVPKATSQQVSVGEIVADAIAVPGAELEYTIELQQGQELIFDLMYNTALRLIDFELLSPAGSRVVEGTFPHGGFGADYSFVAPTSGLYPLTFTSQAEGLVAFRFVEGSNLPSLPPTADLTIDLIDLPTRVVGDPAIIEVEWEVTNSGSVAVPANTVLADQIQLSADAFPDGHATDLPVAVFETTLDSDLAPGQSYRRREALTMPSGFSGELHLVIQSDFLNAVFEGNGDNDLTNNRDVSQRVAVYPNDRTLGGSLLPIRLDVEDRATFPAGTELALSGEVSRASEVTNLVFVIDVSGSTTLVTGLDANLDGQINEADNYNGDDRIGDVLDVGIASMLRVTDWFEERVDDLLVSVIAFGSEDVFGRGELGSVPLDLGAERFNQSFQDVTSDANGNSTADFEESVSSLYAILAPFNNRSGATKFREFRINTGNDFGTAIEVLTGQLERAPSSDATHVFFLTDGEPTTEGDVSDQQLTALAGQRINWNGVQLTLDEISEPLTRATDQLNASERSTGRSFLVTDSTLLSDTIISSVEFAGVTVNQQPVETFDSANRFSTPIILEEGENTFVITAIDAEGRTLSRTLTLIGTAEPEPEQRRDLTSLVDAEFSTTTFNRQTNTLHALLTVESKSVSPPLEASFNNFPSPSVTLSNADRVGLDGEPVRQIAELGSTIDVQFANPLRERFDFDLTITGTLNSPPSFTTAPDARISSGTNYTYRPAADDPDGDQLTYSLEAGPDGMSIDANSGIVAWQTRSTDIEIHTVRLSVSDSRGGTAVQSYQLTVTDAAINNAPLFASSPSVQADVGDDYHYDAIASDIDGDPLTFSLETSPEEMTVDPSTGVVLWPDTTAGEFEVSLRVQDGRGGIATQGFTISVGELAANDTGRLICTAFDRLSCTSHQ